MKAVHDRQRTRQQPAAVRVEDLISAEILADELVDREHLERVFQDPQHYLPPPRTREPRAKARPEPSPEPERPLARRAKLAGLLLAAAVLIGSVAAAAVLTNRQRDRPPAAEPGKPQITGAVALGGFAAPGRKDDAGHEANDAAAAGTSPSGGGDHAATTTTPTPTSSSSPPGTSRPPDTRYDAGRSSSSADKVAAVRGFYSLVDTDPFRALALLDPLLAGEQPGDLVRSWGAMDSVEVEQAQVQPDGSVRAVVTMRQPDGSRLRITQLLRLAEGTADKIVQAWLLSAEQF
ncbi:hypothetical protein [Amycolatopsis nigrescens]|uniref:hypothetical protein n=1 Tax=Amycolatopsis nigrescens TaxID=381445 RepID=UPI000684ACB8|nr:hypothetical protein [Amycolatopsis nigrescens]